MFSICLRMFGTYILNQKFDSIGISVLRDIKKSAKNHLYQGCEEQFFWLIIIPKCYLRISEFTDCSKSV